MLESLSGPQIGYLGGIMGTAIGFAGGAIGTYCSIKNTGSRQERHFMIRAAGWMWIALLVFLGLMAILPFPYQFLLWIPYGFCLPVGIRYINKRQAEIRAAQDSLQGAP